MANGQKRFGPQKPLWIGVGIDVADVGDIIALLLHPESERELPKQKLAGALGKRRIRIW